MTNADNSYHKQKKQFSKYPLMYPTWLSKSFIIYFIYVFIRVSKYTKASCEIKKLVNDWRNSFKNKKCLYPSSFHIFKLFAKVAI